MLFSSNSFIKFCIEQAWHTASLLVSRRQMLQQKQVDIRIKKVE
ncbi:hypothetical Protein YC6258_04725 [Gynuella sunshinyii YC6258]|uniref:Uncharacterized protein n=1 Tax=Gynuella sunshinyii YC6258 TaxID=1445510 RepID=A0A0C5VQC5_9GAMM|nr:hypothetical Protein YC6258_04725 [Gynuella sunshinyii YC6258]